jgi:hypothetical protein
MTALRDTLERLAPEPPDDLGLASTARRRARSLRRRRTLAASTTALAVLAGAAFAGNALPREREATGPSYARRSEFAGTFPNWPRRGDADPSVDRAAIDAWTRSVRERGAEVVGVPRVLYAGGAGGGPVVVLHGTAYPGGDRVAAVTFEAGTATLKEEGAAPLPGVVGLVLTLDSARTDPVGVDGDMCFKGPADDPAHDTRVLVLAAPGIRHAEWHSDGFPPQTCGPDSPLVTAPREAPLDDGVALVHVPMGPYTRIAWWLTDADGLGNVPRGFGPVSPLDGLPAPHRSPRGWPQRSDSSGALWEGSEVCRSLTKGDPGCQLTWAQSLPDGTTAGAFAVPGWNAQEGVEPWFFADATDGTVRAYRMPGGVVAALAAVLPGRSGRWLAVVGPASMTTATLRANGASRTVPLVDGTGFLRLSDGDDLGGATVETSEGTVPVAEHGGQVVR